MPAFDRITPVVLTYNEAPNIARTLQRLDWAERIVVVDSGSDDGTVSILGSTPNVDLFSRAFDTHQEQWNYGLAQVGTEWTLALDADYLVSRELMEEIQDIPDDSRLDGFFVAFRHFVLGRELSRILYPPRQVLFRTARARFLGDGHTQRVRVEGPSGRLLNPILHDDRKSLDRWLRNQIHYAHLEVEKISSTPWRRLSTPDRIRRTRILGPPSVFLYCLIGKGLILKGWPGWYYTFERTAAEMILSLALLRSDERMSSPDPASGRRVRC